MSGMKITRWASIWSLFVCGLPLMAGTYGYVVYTGGGTLERVTQNGTVTVIATNLRGREATAGLPQTGGGWAIPSYDSVTWVSPAGTVKTIATAPSGSQFIAITTDGYGNFIVADNQKHGLWRVAPDGSSSTFFASYPSTGGTLEDVKVVSDGKGGFIVANDSYGSTAHIYRVAPDGTSTELSVSTTPKPGLVSALARGVGDDIYVGDDGADSILKMRPGTPYSTIVSGGELSPRVYGLAFNAAAGELVAAIPGGGKLVRVRPDGTVLGTIAVPNPAAVMIDYGSDNANATGALQYFPVAPCRVADTRAGQGTSGAFGPPSLSAGGSRSIPVASGNCGIPSSAKAYSLNVTLVPKGYLGYLTLWPTGQSQPYVSTLNSPSGRIVANAAIVPAGTGGAVSVYATDATDVILDINGYFAPPAFNSLRFFPTTPCRVEDTRLAAGAFGGPAISAGQSRDFLVPQGGCSIPATAQAFSMNTTVVPGGPLGYLTLSPTGQQRPFVSTLNSDGRGLANAALVPAGSNGGVNVYATDTTDAILDINGYFSNLQNGGTQFYPVPPCRVGDTRATNWPLQSPSVAAGATRDIYVTASNCGVPSSATAYSLNITVVPNDAVLGYLSLWPMGVQQPFVSTLNASDRGVVANAALVPAGVNGAISVYVTHDAHVIVDVNGYFAPLQ